MLVVSKKVACDECIASWGNRFISRYNIGDVHAVEDSFHVLLPDSVVEGVELLTATVLGGVMGSLVDGRGVVEG